MAFKLRDDKKDTEIKSVRFPIDIIEEIENAIRKTNVSFSGFVVQACRYALDNMVTEDKEQ